MDNITESGLPSGFKDVQRREQTLNVPREEIPWLETSERVHLAKVTLQGTNGIFYLGSMIRGEVLVHAADQLDPHRSRIANHLLYSQLPELITKGFNSRVDIIRDPVTEKPIYYLGNPGGQRVYFMRFDNIEGVPVIIRIAVCDKARQLQVLRVLTTWSSARIKATGKL